MSEPTEKAARQAWQSTMTAAGAASAGAAVERRLTAYRRNVRPFWLSAVFIVAAWIAAIWWRPDLRVAASAGLTVSAWLMWQVYQRSPARARPHASELPCAAFEIALLTRERDFYASMPKWFFSVVGAFQAVLIMTVLTNPRFQSSGVTLSAFVAMIVVAMGIGYRRSRHMVNALNREIVALGKRVEA